jgi:HSP20 family protein
MATTQQDVAQRDTSGATQQPQTQIQRTEAAMRPPVDIFEATDGITLQADMPGVTKDRLNVQVEGNTLLIEGALQLDMPEQMEALYADVRSTLYRCSFVLSAELESGRIEANLKDGVLTVRIPKRDELRPRRIQVQTA